MNPKPQPNHEQLLRVLRSMAPGQRLARALELSASVRRIFRAGLRRRFPDLDEAAFHKPYLERLALAHNRNW